MLVPENLEGGQPHPVESLEKFSSFLTEAFGGFHTAQSHIQATKDGTTRVFPIYFLAEPSGLGAIEAAQHACKAFSASTIYLRYPDQRVSHVSCENEPDESRTDG